MPRGVKSTANTSYTKISLIKPDAPVFTGNAEITVETDQTVDYGDVTATGFGEVTITHQPTELPESYSEVGEYTVVYTAEDSLGYTSTFTQTITVTSAK